MLAFIGRSAVQKIITLFFVSVVSFLIIHLAPGQPSQVDPLNPKFTPEMVERYRQEFHLDKPLYIQYVYSFPDCPIHLMVCSAIISPPLRGDYTTKVGGVK